MLRGLRRWSVTACAPNAVTCLTDHKTLQTCNASGVPTTMTCPTRALAPHAAARVAGYVELQGRQQDGSDLHRHGHPHRHNDVHERLRRGPMQGPRSPGTTSCVDNKTIQTCNNMGIFANPTPCPNACVGNVCGGMCSPGDATCLDNKTLRTCDNTGTNHDTTCTNVCSGGTGTGTCSPGDTRCVDANTKQTCAADGTWGASVDCVGQACVGKVCTGACSPGDTKCLDGTHMQNVHHRGRVGRRDFLHVRVLGQNLRRRVRSHRYAMLRRHPRANLLCDGSWGMATSCMYVCTGKDCGGVCTPTTKLCSDSTHLMTCAANGTWGAGVLCTSSACVGSACTGVCSPTTTMCADNKNVQTCSAAGDGASPPPARTPASATLAAAPVRRATLNALGTRTFKPAAPPEPGGQRLPAPLLASVMRAPDMLAGRYDVRRQQECPDVLGGRRVGSLHAVHQCLRQRRLRRTCSPGDTMCATNKNVQTCSAAGAWGVATPCTNACVANACGGQCSPGATRCSTTDSNQPQTCGSAGQWGNTGLPCDNGCIDPGVCAAPPPPDGG